MIVSIYEEEDELARKVPLDEALDTLRERLENLTASDERSLSVSIFVWGTD